jgi:hypothetical protein
VSEKNQPDETGATYKVVFYGGERTFSSKEGAEAFADKLNGWGFDGEPEAFVTRVATDDRRRDPSS